jgi:GxxExxY protein
VERQVAIPITYGELRFDEGFRVDLFVENKVIVELKSVERLNNAHRKQLLTYLRLGDKRLGYLLNFGELLMRDGIVRTANRLSGIQKSEDSLAKIAKRAKGNLTSSE